MQWPNKRSLKSCQTQVFTNYNISVLFKIWILIFLDQVKSLTHFVLAGSERYLGYPKKLWILFIPVTLFGIVPCNCLEFLVHFFVEIFPQKERPESEQCIHFLRMASTQTLPVWNSEEKKIINFWKCCPIIFTYTFKWKKIDEKFSKNR